jgi:hypothetical protein
MAAIIAFGVLLLLLTITIATTIIALRRFFQTFEGLAGSSFTGDIALDDINVKYGACNSSGIYQ